MLQREVKHLLLYHKYIETLVIQEIYVISSMNFENLVK